MEVKSYKKFSGYNFCAGLATFESETMNQIKALQAMD